MSASVPRDLASGVAGRPVVGRRTAPLASRLRLRIERSLWPADRALAELRWAGVTLFLMLAMALPAHLLADESGTYARASVVSGIALIVAAILALGPRASWLARQRVVRLAAGPAVVLISLIAAGPHDPVSMAAPEGRPFIIMAITFAALTPGFWLAAGIVAVSSTGLWVDHVAIHGQGVFDQQAVDFWFRVAVTILGGFAMHAVDRGLRRERLRAEDLTARRLARADQLEGLQRIVGRFDGSRPVAQVMQDVVDDVAATFDIPLVSAYLPDEQRRLSMVGVAGYDNPFHIIETGVGIIGRAAATRETNFVPDVLADPGYKAARDDVRSEVAVPVLHGGELLGIVNFEGTAARPIMPAHVAVAEMLARSIAAALHSARLDEERQQRLHAVERVLEVSRGLASNLDRRRVVASVVEAARDLLTAEPVEFASRGEDGAFRVEQLVGDESRLWSEVVPDDGLAGEVLASGRRVVRPGDDERPAGLGFPIRLEEGVDAVLTVERDRAHGTFTELELRIADLLVVQIEAALRNAELHARVSEAAVRDPLTGLLNRRYFDEAVETAFATAVRTDSDLSLIVLDLDRFSEVNNVHGHAVGDTVLRRVARAMVSVARTGDVVARYGGEEFVVIAPGTDTAGAVQLAERIRAAVAADADTPVDGPHVPIRVSAGVASRLGDEADGRALFRAADSALLAAKRAGRDRVISL